MDILTRERQSRLPEPRHTLGYICIIILYIYTVYIYIFGKGIMNLHKLRGKSSDNWSGINVRDSWAHDLLMMKS